MVSWVRCRNGGGEKWENSVYILKVEPIGFANGGVWEKERSQDKSKDLSLSNWKGEIAIYKIGRIVGRLFKEESQQFCFKHV